MNRDELKAKYRDEEVLVIPTASVPALNEGFNRMFNDEILNELDENAEFMLRWEAEYNKEYRQPIPYILLRHNKGFFGTRRLQGSGESRLHGKISLGVGGHINPEDDSIFAATNMNGIFYTAAYRELNEEVFLSTNNRIINMRFIGILNDTFNDVSQDHIGLVILIDLLDDDVRVKETDKLEGRYYTDEELGLYYGNLESWSKIIFKNKMKRFL